MRAPGLPRSLWARLTAGLVALLAVVCLAVAAVTVPALRGFLVDRLDEQLAGNGGRFAASLEHEERPDRDNEPDTRGQADGTFGARLIGGDVTRAAVVRGSVVVVPALTAEDRRALAALPPDGPPRDVDLSALGDYRMLAVSGDDGDVLVTGLPLHPVEETVDHLLAVELIVFGTALVVTAVAAAWWVRLSLRPLRRVADRATEVTRLPLADEEVAMPEPLPDTDPRTEVGRVGAALNHLLGHVGDAIARRQASEERLRHFAADASHELRTPVAGIRGHAELALRHGGPMPGEVRHGLERILAESERMSALVDDMLLLARLDAGRPPARGPVDLTRLVLDATSDARAAAPGHRWRLDLPRRPVVVTGDEHRLQQVVTNLLANARTHTPPGTEVTVTLTASPEGARLAVADDGPGIPPDLRERVFDRFVRGDAGRARGVTEGGSGGGTGLGLAIVQAVVTAHGGTVGLSSRPGSTVFLVTLPRGDDPGDEAGDAPEDAGPADDVSAGDPAPDDGPAPGGHRPQRPGVATADDPAAHGGPADGRAARPPHGEPGNRPQH